MWALTAVWAGASHKDWDFLTLAVDAKPGSGLAMRAKRNAERTMAWIMAGDCLEGMPAILLTLEEMAPPEFSSVGVLEKEDTRV